MRIEQVHVQIPVNNKARVTVKLALSNTLDIPLEYLSASYRVSLAGHELAKGIAQVKGRGSAGSSAVVTLPMIIDLTRLMAAGGSGKQGKPGAPGQGAVAHISWKVHLLRASAPRSGPASASSSCRSRFVWTPHRHGGPAPGHEQGFKPQDPEDRPRRLAELAQDEVENGQQAPAVGVGAPPLRREDLADPGEPDSRLPTAPAVLLRRQVAHPQVATAAGRTA